MADEAGTSKIVKAIGVFLIFFGVMGVVSGIYGLTVVGDLASTSFSTREASKAVLDVSLQITKDKDNITASLMNTKGKVTQASSGLLDVSADLSESSTSLEKASGDIDGAAQAMKSSAQADREAAAQITSSADAMDLLWGPTDVAIALRAAAAKIEESAGNVESAAAKLEDAGSNTLSAAAHIRDSSTELATVSADLTDTGESLDSVGSSIDSMTQRFISNLNELVEGLQWLETVDKNTVLYEVLIYFIVINLVFAGTGVALVLLSANLYGW